jgi:hypothetical protein
MSGPWTVLVLLQLVALGCIVQPWNEAWRGAGLTVFAVEAILVVALFLPVFGFQRVRRGRSTREAARVAADVLLDQLTALVP